MWPMNLPQEYVVPINRKSAFVQVGGGSLNVEAIKKIGRLTKINTDRAFVDFVSHVGCRVLV
jgi:hypothetical protein